MGGFSTAFDLVSSEYGWTDEVIWELPISRLRQVTAAIQRRRYLSSREENSRVSWLARNISMFVAGGYQIDKGKKNPASEIAQTLAYDDVEAALMGRQSTNSASDGRTSGDFALRDRVADIDPEEAMARAAERNSAGSFNRFMGMMSDMETRGKMI